MKYAKWATEKEIQNILVKGNMKNQEGEGGIPLLWKQDVPYLDGKDTHTILIGGCGSGKTQSVILPYIKYTMLKGEGLVINDSGNEIYKRVSQKLDELGYKIIVYNFANPNLSYGFNPLALAYQFYQENKFDEAFRFLEVTANSFFGLDLESDPFWTNAAISLFKGLSLYLFSKANHEEINLTSLYFLADELENDKKCEAFINNIKDDTEIYILLQMVLKAPHDTKASIISVFTSKLKEYLARNNLGKLLAHNDFSLLETLSSKTAIFINGEGGECSEVLTSLLIKQLYEVQKILPNKQKINVILDDFDELPFIKDFANILNTSRSLKMRFLIGIKGYTNLMNTYGNYFDIIKMCFDNIIYLKSNDLKTITSFSLECQESAYHEPLINPLELKQLKIFEAVILLPRMMPFKVSLVPDYKINWPFKNQEKIFSNQEFPEVKIFKLK